MDLSIFDISVTLAAVTVSVALPWWVQRASAVASERRMARMLMYAAEVRPRLPVQGESAGVIEQLRRRCRGCKSAAWCERWLAGEVPGDNHFCANVQVIGLLPAVAKPDSSRRTPSDRQ